MVVAIVCTTCGDPRRARAADLQEKFKEAQSRGQLTRVSHVAGLLKAPCAKCAGTAFYSTTS
jgi:hypothetical protein